MPQFPLHHNKPALPVCGNSMEWRRQIDFGLMFQRCDMIWLCIQHTTVFCQCQMRLLFRYAIYIYICLFLLIWIYIFVFLCLYIYIFIVLRFHLFIYIFFILHTFTTCANVVTIPNSIMLQPQQWIPYTFSAGIPGIEEWQDPGEWQRNRITVRLW